MLSKISSHQLSEWMAFERLEPFEGWRGDYRNALLISQVLNAMIAMVGGKGRTKTGDYVPDFLGAFLPDQKASSQASDSSKQIGGIFSGLAPKGAVKIWAGMAPPIKRIGKRGKPTPRKRRLQEILHGKPRNTSIPDRG